mmetsp:Transcript_94785/g.267593  ORF Transcript_94785/g.267593 Transcript_94785/m.267593 type:complete len:268 (-) Transcript_94785:2917-3720(-)
MVPAGVELRFPEQPSEPRIPDAEGCEAQPLRTLDDRVSEAVQEERTIQAIARAELPRAHPERATLAVAANYRQIAWPDEHTATCQLEQADLLRAVADQDGAVRELLELHAVRTGERARLPDKKALALVGDAGRGEVGDATGKPFETHDAVRAAMCSNEVRDLRPSVAEVITEVGAQILCVETPVCVGVGLVEDLLQVLGLVERRLAHEFPWRWLSRLNFRRAPFGRACFHIAPLHVRLSSPLVKSLLVSLLVADLDRLAKLQVGREC